MRQFSQQKENQKPSNRNPEEEIPKLVVYRRSNDCQKNAQLKRQNSKTISQSPKKTTQMKKINAEVVNQVEFDSEKIILEYLGKNENASITEEIENQSDAMIEKQILTYQEERETIEYKLQLYKNQISHLQKNDTKVVIINQNMQLMIDKLELIDKVTKLFRDKQTMRIQIFNQKILITQLSEKIVQLETKFTDQLHQLKIYNASLPTEKERQLMVQNQKLISEIENEQILREKLEKSLQMNISNFEKLFTEASEAKIHILDQLKSVKQKKDDLEQQIKLTEEAQHQFKFIGKPQGQIITLTDRRISIQQHLNNSSSSSNLNKFQNKSNLNTQDNLKRDKNSLTNFLTNLNNDKSGPSTQSGTPQLLTPPISEGQKRQQSLAIIDENEKTSPKSIVDDSSLENSSGSANILNIPKKKY